MARTKPLFTAKTADRHTLYQLSVQAPDHEIELVSGMYRRHTGKRALHLREDFCGTGLFSAAWAKSHRDRRAVGLDIDRPTLAWGREHNLLPLEPGVRSRVTLLERDVLAKPTSERFDLVCAFNYSYQTFQSRPLLERYFRAARAALQDDGLFVLDLMGGWAAHQELEEVRAVRGKRDGFLYVWEQASFDPISHHFLAHIHFRFHDGTEMKRAFTYDWRLYTIPELRESLLAAGFVQVDVYCEGDDGEGHGDGVFKRTERTHDDPGWNVYLVAKKSPPSPGAPDAKRLGR